MEAFCKALPKIELHAHLNGSLSKSTLLALGCAEANIQQYQKLTDILNKSSRTLDECFELFQVAHRATNNPKNLYIATLNVIEEFHQDNVIYLELRTTPRAEETMTRQEYIETVIKAINDARNEWSIIVKLILCLDRRFSSEVCKEVMDLIITMHETHPNEVVGVDLCGNPKEGYFPKEQFQRARDAGLKVTLHCAEVKSHDEEVEMLDFGPERLGHGTFLHAARGLNEKTFEVEQLKQIPLEICLSSNVICGTVSGYADHHINKWIENGLPYCLCTDDKGVFMCDLSKEYFMAHRHHIVEKEDLYQVSLKSIDYIFAGEDVQNALKSKLLEWKTTEGKHYFQ